MRFTLPRDLYHGKDALEALKTLTGKKAIVVVGGGSMKRFGFLDKVVDYLKEAGMEVQLFEGVEPDPSVDTVMKGAEAMRQFGPDWIVAIGGGSPHRRSQGYVGVLRVPGDHLRGSDHTVQLPDPAHQSKILCDSLHFRHCHRGYRIFRYHRLQQGDQISAG